MKKVIVYCVALLLMSIVGCQKESLHLEETETAKEEITQKGGGLNETPEISNQLVIQYPEGTTEAEKIIKRAEYNIESYEKCACADPNLELWVFEDVKNPYSGGNIETKRAEAESDDGLEGADYNPNIKIQEDLFVDYGGIGSIDDGLLNKVSTNQGVTVAVLDTGVMYDYPGFTSPFLYNSGQDGCSDNGYNDLFGWNFVDKNNNPYDNHRGRHGTIVSSLIASKLEMANIDYQILPVKIANENGNIRYFDALCGFQYAANNPDVNIINMSFGWNQHERELLEKFIDEATDVLVVTSAGNKGVNNDVYPHYPSSYESDNLLAVAALKGNGSQNSEDSNITINSAASIYGYLNNSGLASFSNRGTYSVDIAAPGENLPFTYNNEILYIDGTSYSAALTSGYSGTKYEDGMTGISFRNKVIENCVYDPNLSEIQYAKHIPE